MFINQPDKSIRILLGSITKLVASINKVSKNSGTSRVEENQTSPLMPQSALEYFSDGNSGNRLYLRATSIRNCLENIVETIFIHIIDDESKRGWEKLALYKKINLLSSFFPREINDRLHYIRKTGNKGAHQSGHKDLDETEVNITLDDLSKICEWTILAYFKKHGFIEHPWIPTVFSTLPPVYRVRILEELFNPNDIDKDEVVAHLESVQNFHHQLITGQIEFTPQPEPTEEERKLGGFLLLIDKLAMAYLKNRERVKSIQFINELHDKGFINSIFKKQMLDKLDVLWREIENLPISANLSQTRDNLNKILPAIKKEEESLFITLFIAITAQSS